MKKNKLWIILWIASILYALAIISIPVLYILNASDFEARKQVGEFVREYSFSTPFRIAGLLTFVFWIYNITVWRRRKDGVLHLLLLLLLNVIYLPIYYIRELK